MLLALAAMIALPGTPTNPVVPVPRITEAAVQLDGRMDEPVWRRAAVLRGFGQYLPTDGRPAADSTEVLVWYAPTAIYFGIRAYQDSAAVRATLADRDHIFGDDHVLVLLDTFNDRRRALAFGVNPFGIQADGTFQDAARQAASMMTAAATGAYAVDLNPDYVFDSRGRVTAWGYEIEIRIPFKSVAYPSREPQDWGINVIRRVQASGHESTWTGVLQSDASFLSRSGTLQGLTELRRGLVLDITPEVTSTVAGAPTEAGWEYGEASTAAGVTARWGVTPNLTLNGTVNPDFSQVESDVAQIVYDPRDALFYPEKRPFFLEGIEWFRTPVRLVYTRRLVDPIAAAQMFGKVGGTSLAFLSGLDEEAMSRSGTDRPLLSAVRLRRDVGGQNTIGLTYTGFQDGATWNRVGALDGRWVVRGGHTVTAQGGASGTRGSDGVTHWGPFWTAAYTKSGRRWAVTATTRGFDDDFRAAAGYVPRVGIAYVSAQPSYTRPGAPGAALESWSASILVDGRWEYDRFFEGTSPDDGRMHYNVNVALRGGWQLGASLLTEWFGYPPDLYEDYAIALPVAGGAVDTVPFVGTPRLYNLDGVINLSTPRFQSFALDVSVVFGRDDNFYEWAPADILIGTLDLTWRPSEQLRVNLLYNHQQYIRPGDRSTVGMRRVPRLKVEYQLTRAIFLRVVGQYDAAQVDALRDDSRTNAPILIFDPGAGTFVQTVAEHRNDLQADVLFSYRPTPGTVFFAGYGSGLTEPDAFRFTSVRRTADGFFVKLSYLFRA